MQAQAFIRKWGPGGPAHELNERAGAQAHFIDLCRIVAKPGFEKDLAKRTLTNLYNQRPAWLAQAHDTLDATVAAAYGWADYTPSMPDDEILRRLLALNLARATGPGAASPASR